MGCDGGPSRRTDLDVRKEEEESARFAREVMLLAAWTVLAQLCQQKLCGCLRLLRLDEVTTYLTLGRQPTRPEAPHIAGVVASGAAVGIRLFAINSLSRSLRVTAKSTSRGSDSAVERVLRRTWAAWGKRQLVCESTAKRIHERKLMDLPPTVLDGGTGFLKAGYAGQVSVLTGPHLVTPPS